MNFPDPVIGLAIEPKTQADTDRLSIGLNKLSEEDPTFRVKTDEDSGQTIISGMGELHLEIIVDRLKREFKVEVNQGAPQVAYKEAIRGSVESEGKYIKQSGGRGKYGHCWLKIEPLEKQEGFEFVNGIVGGIIPKEYISSIQKGCEEIMQNGALAGYPILGVKATVYDGSYHDVDSDELSFKQAAVMAMKDGILKANPVLLEPIMKVEVVCPNENMGDIIGDLNSRRGQVLGSNTRGQNIVIEAHVPIETLFGYISTIRSLTKGRASASMVFDHYNEVPRNIQEKIVASRAR